MKEGVRRKVVVIGCIVIFLIVGYGAVTSIRSARVDAGPQAPCYLQYETWRKQTSGWRFQLKDALARGDQARVRGAAEMLWAIAPPQCKAGPYHWQRLMQLLAHDKPLTPSMVKYMYWLTTIEYHGQIR